MGYQSFLHNSEVIHIMNETINYFLIKICIFYLNEILDRKRLKIYINIVLNTNADKCNPHSIFLDFLKPYNIQIERYKLLV